MRCWTRHVRPRSASLHEIAEMLPRVRLLRAEHSVPSTRARSHVPISPLSVSCPSSPVSLSGTSQGIGFIRAHPMLGCAAWAGSRTILTLWCPSWSSPGLASRSP
ncbi:hypothetical protein T09_4727 [Trichinella sp. T9]|nr:hypothetical protein T09_4727 [Trichinella sp. T9]